MKVVCQLFVGEDQGIWLQEGGPVKVTVKVTVEVTVEVTVKVTGEVTVKVTVHARGQ